MTRLDAEYLEDTTFIDYNKAHYSKFMGYQLDNKKVIAEEWLLKPQYLSTGINTYDRMSGHFSNDLSNNGRSVIVIGTELQTFRKFEEMLKTYGWQTQDDWQVELKPQYLEYYKENNNSPIIINLK
tara:strand:+ start:394 stop:771 length:378 start_codon:yes stop_codon:yes gene_type:complete